MKPLEERDFLPCPDSPIISAPGRIPTQEPQGRLLFEKVTELAFSQNETCRVTRERDALAAALRRIAAGGVKEPQRFAGEVLAQLGSGELRKVGV